jgi:CheY-like chemotaxis protein
LAYDNACDLPQGKREVDSAGLHGAPRSASLDHAPLTILYIEDNATNFLLVERVFATDPEIELLRAASAQEGIELARALRPGLILLDVHLPDGQGEQVLSRLQAEPQTRAIPVIAITADARKHQRERLLAAGAEAYLTKPITISRLLDLVAGIRGERA